jgi:O-antigen/teichoic acid export membrane protein
MTQFRRSVIYSFINRYTVTAINIVMTAVLSRLLTPNEIGVFILGAAAVALIETVRDFGVSSYIIQEPQISPLGIRTTFTILLVTSATFAAIVFFAAMPLAEFYGDGRVASVLRITAFGFLAGPFAGPNMALLKRDMLFAAIAKIEIAGAVVNSVVAVGLALAGDGYLSLAWASVTSSVTIAVGAMAVHPRLWMFRPSLAEWRKVASFGGYSSATGFVNILFQTLPQLILGRLLSLDAVAAFSRATAICQLPDRMFLAVFQPLMLPAIAAEARNGNNLKQLYLRSAGNLAVVVWPALICMACLAELIVRLLLGSKWLDVIPLVRWISIASLFMFPAILTYPLLVSLGRIRDTLVSSLISLPTSMVIICLAAVWGGIIAVAASLILTNLIVLFVAVAFIQRYVALTWTEFARALSKSALVTLCTACVPLLALAIGGSDLSIVSAMAVAIAAVLVWLVALQATEHSLFDELRSFPGVSKILPGKRRYVANNVS